MRHLLLYEGYISDMENELQSVQNKYRSELDSTMMALIDVYEFKFLKYEDSSFYYSSDATFTVDDKFIRELETIRRKLTSLGLTFTIHTNYGYLNWDGYIMGLSDPELYGDNPHYCIKSFDHLKTTYENKGEFRIGNAVIRLV